MNAFARLDDLLPPNKRGIHPLQLHSDLYGDLILGLVEIGFWPKGKRSQLFKKSAGFRHISNLFSIKSPQLIRILGYYNGVNVMSLLKPEEYFPDILIHYSHIPDDALERLSNREKNRILGNPKTSREKKEILKEAFKTDNIDLFRSCIKTLDSHFSSDGQILGRTIEVLILNEIKYAIKNLQINYMPNRNVHMYNASELTNTISEVDSLLTTYEMQQFIGLTSRLRKRTHLIIKDRWT